MYGTQDESNARQKLWGEHLSCNGFELGASNPALYRSELVNGICHGDDFVTAAAEHQIESFGKLLYEKVRYETDRHDRCSRTLGQRTGSVAQILSE